MSDQDNNNSQKKIKKKPKNLLPLGHILNGRYKIIERFGQGAFGEIYAGIDMNLNSIVAIKTERLNPPPPNHRISLHYEAQILNALKSSPYVVPFYNYDRQTLFFHNGGGQMNANVLKKIQIHYIVMKRLGENLSNLLKNQGNRFSLPTTIQLGVQMLNAIQSVHEHGFIHRDIKPSNFVIPNPSDNSEENELYLIDFGLSKSYKILETGELKPCRQKPGFRGTAKYASVNALKQKDLGRRDDLWCIFYSILDFSVGRLPWTFLKNKESIMKLKMCFNKIDPTNGEENERYLKFVQDVLMNDPDYLKILNRVAQFSQMQQHSPEGSPTDQLQSMANALDNSKTAALATVARTLSFPIITPAHLPPELIQFRESLKGLRFQDEPDYDYLRSLLFSWYQRCQFDPNLPFDWEKKPENVASSNGQPTDVTFTGLTEKPGFESLCVPNLTTRTLSDAKSMDRLSTNNNNEFSQPPDGERSEDNGAEVEVEADGEDDGDEKVIDVKEEEDRDAGKDVDILIQDKNADQILNARNPEFMMRVAMFKKNKVSNQGTQQTRSNHSPAKKGNEINFEKFSSADFFEKEPPVSPSSMSRLSNSGKKKSQNPGCSVM